MKFIAKAITSAINLIVKKFLARKLTIILAIPPKSIADDGPSGTFADLDEASFSAAAIAASCFAPKSSVSLVLLKLIEKLYKLKIRMKCIFLSEGTRHSKN